MTYRGGPSETQLRFLQALGALRDVGYRGPLDISPTIAEATLAYLRDPEEHRRR